jgi:competence protein ComEA
MFLSFARIVQNPWEGQGRGDLIRKGKFNNKRRRKMQRPPAWKYLKYSLLFFLAGFIGMSFTLGLIPAYAQAPKTLVDLNTASQKDLESLKGIGPATAKKIIDSRPYKSVEDLKKAGVSEKTIESLKPLVKVGAVSAPAKPAADTKPAAPASSKSAADTKTAAPQPAGKTKPKTATPAKLAPGQKVNINTATKEQLEALPEIGPVKAQSIIEGRPYKKAEDIMKVKGIKEGTFNKVKDFITVQ